jgi:hypothetical protein
MEMADLIIAEVRAVGSKQDELAKKMDDYMTAADKRLTIVETQLHPIVGNGQPGLCQQRLVMFTDKEEALNKRVTKLENWRYWVLGIAAATTTLAGLIAWWIEHS